MSDVNYFREELVKLDKIDEFTEKQKRLEELYIELVNYCEKNNNDDIIKEIAEYSKRR